MDFFAVGPFIYARRGVHGREREVTTAAPPGGPSGTHSAAVAGTRGVKISVDFICFDCFLNLKNGLGQFKFITADVINLKRSFDLHCVACSSS